MLSLTWFTAIMIIIFHVLSFPVFFLSFRNFGAFKLLLNDVFFHFFFFFCITAPDKNINPKKSQVFPLKLRSLKIVWPLETPKGVCFFFFFFQPFLLNDSRAGSFYVRLKIVCKRASDNCTENRGHDTNCVLALCPPFQIQCWHYLQEQLQRRQEISTPSSGQVYSPNIFQKQIAADVNPL